MKKECIHYEYDAFEVSDKVRLVVNNYPELGAAGDEFTVRNFWGPDAGVGRTSLVFLEGYKYGHEPAMFDLI